MADVIRVWPLRALHDWFMRKKDFDGEDAILIDELVEAGILEYRAPGGPRPTCRECANPRPCAVHDTPRATASEPGPEREGP